jgi:hypothetical protein
MTNDPWSNRQKGMICMTCIYYVEKCAPTPEKDYEKTVREGVIERCRRHAPTMSGFPVVFKNDWCGDHKLDETKV